MTVFSTTGLDGIDGQDGQDATDNPYTPATDGTDGGNGDAVVDVIDFGAIYGPLVPGLFQNNGYLREVTGGNGGRGGKGGDNELKGPAGQSGDGGAGGSATVRFTNLEASGQINADSFGIWRLSIGSLANGGQGNDGNIGAIGSPNSAGGNGGDGGAADAQVDDFSIQLGGTGTELSIFARSRGGEGAFSLPPASGAAPVDHDGGQGGQATAGLQNVSIVGKDNYDFVALRAEAFGGNGGASWANGGSYGLGSGGNGGDATATLRNNSVQTGLGEDLVLLMAQAIGGRAGDAHIDGSPGTEGTGSIVLTDNNIGLGGDNDKLQIVAHLTGPTWKVVITGNSFDGGDGEDLLTFYSLLNSVPHGVDFRMALNNVTGFERILGTAADDMISGDAASNTFEGDMGNDVLKGWRGNDILRGGTGSDMLFGGADNDQLFGDGGPDTLDGGDGADDMFGGPGDDTYIVGQTGDTVSELTDTNSDAGGTDQVISAVSFTLGQYVENLTLTGTAKIDGTGNASNNIISGNSAINVLRGGPGNDKLFGKEGADVLNGGRGNDTLFGGPGGDLLIGGFDADILWGGPGDDAFRFNSLGSAATADSVKDFGNGLDRIELVSAAFSVLGRDPLGALSSQRFIAGTTATTADQLLIYDQTSGSLFYDADGVGGNAQVLLALFTNKPLLAASDFFLI